jgi:hypothetical protein
MGRLPRASGSETGRTASIDSLYGINTYSGPLTNVVIGKTDHSYSLADRPRDNIRRRLPRHPHCRRWLRQAWQSRVHPVSWPSPASAPARETKRYQALACSTQKAGMGPTAGGPGQEGRTAACHELSPELVWRIETRRRGTVSVSSIPCRAKSQVELVIERQCSQATQYIVQYLYAASDAKFVRRARFSLSWRHRGKAGFLGPGWLTDSRFTLYQRRLIRRASCSCSTSRRDRRFGSIIFVLCNECSVWRCLEPTAVNSCPCDESNEQRHVHTTG